MRARLSSWVIAKRNHSMADYRLYCFGESGNAYKAALMLELCRLSWEPVFVDFFAGRRHESFGVVIPVDTIGGAERHQTIAQPVVEKCVVEMVKRVLQGRVEDERRAALQRVLWRRRFHVFIRQ